MNPNLNIPSRNECIQLIRNDQTWDVIVIGGGASGLGIALDAVARGYKTLLVEQCDFAKGTSSRSTKLVHGGVRYLAQGDLRLVREASIERGLLHRNAPHLVKDQLFIIPVYNWWERIKYGIGLKLYDKISGKLSLGPSEFISRDETISRLPGIRTEGLLGGISYHDGQFDDSRMAISLMQTIWENGGVAINYMKVIRLQKNIAHKVTGVVLEDMETHEVLQVNSKAVINATGVFADDILQLDEPGAAARICVSQGTHVVVDSRFYSSSYALMIPRTSDGRVLFAVPWHTKVLIGTTDTAVDNARLEPIALEKEISFILENAGKYLAQQPVRTDVLSVFAGLRPLAAPKKGRWKTKEISRGHKIVYSSSQLFTMLGGKWTTYRKMGEDMINKVEKELGWTTRKSQTADLQLHGYSINIDSNDPFSVYGSNSTIIKQSINSDNNKWLSEPLRIHTQQVIWAIEKEMARNIEDVLSRRTRALFLDARECRRIAPEVAHIMANALGKDKKWIDDQLQTFHQLSSTYLLE